MKFLIMEHSLYPTYFVFLIYRN